MAIPDAGEYVCSVPPSMEYLSTLLPPGVTSSMAMPVSRKTRAVSVAGDRTPLKSRMMEFSDGCIS